MMIFGCFSLIRFTKPSRRPMPIEVTAANAVPSHAFAHYLHHKYFEVTMLMGSFLSTGGSAPGTKGGDASMDARFQKRQAKMNARQTPT